MNKVLKKMLMIVLAAVMIVGSLGALASCSKESKIDKDGNITLKYWAIWPEGDPLYKWQQDRIAEFEKANPKVNIEYTGINFWDYFTKILTSQNDAKGPDIYMQTVTDNGFRATGGISLDIKKYFNKDMGTFKFNDMDTKALSHNGGVYGVPYSTDGRVFYYNIDMVNELKDISQEQWLATKAAKKSNSTITGIPANLLDADGNVRGPKTYDEIMAYSELLTKRGAEKKITRLGFDVSVGNNSITNFVWTLGGTFFDENANPIVNTNEGVRKGFETWKEISRVNPVADVNAFIDSGSGGANASENLFWSKKLAMMIATNEIPWKNDKLSDKDKVNIGACTIPYIDNNRYNFSGGFSMELAKRLEKEDPRVAQAAYDFLAFMMSDDVQVKVLTETSNMPGNVSIYSQLTKNETNKAKLVVIQEMDYRRPFDFVAKAPNWWTPVMDNLTKYVSGKSELDKALKDAQDGILNIIKIS